MPTATGSVMRRLRGALGVGLVWAIGWGLVAAGLAFVETWGQLSTRFFSAWFLQGFMVQVLLGGLFGFASGVLFAIVLAALSRASWFKARSIWPFVAAGGLGMAGTEMLYIAIRAGYLFARSGVAVGIALGWFGLLGAVSSMATLAIVRHADRRALPDPGRAALPDGAAG